MTTKESSTPPPPGTTTTTTTGTPTVSKDLSFRVREKALDSPRSGLGPRTLSRGGSGMGSGSGSGWFNTTTNTSPRVKKNPLKPESEVNKRFLGIWEADEVDGLEAYVAELGLSKSFKRLSDRFAGSSHVELKIEQEGDLFSIQDSTEMRETLSVFVVGTPYESESERGEEVVVHTSWDGQVLVMVSKPKNGEGNTLVVRRWIEGDKLMQTHNVFGKDKAMARREFVRIG